MENQPVRVSNQQQIKQEFQSNHNNQRTPQNQPVSLNQMQNVPQASLQQTIPQSQVLTSLPQSPFQQSVLRLPVQQDNPQICMRQISNPHMLNQLSTAQKLKKNRRISNQLIYIPTKIYKAQLTYLSNIILVALRQV